MSQARTVKRGIDIAVAGTSLAILSPALALIALLVRVKLGSPVLFRQVRPGLYGQPFTLLKFRTMRDAIDDSGRPLPDAQRLTELGRILRRTSVDELPGLWNVVRGDMSLVGPRPLLMRYTPYFTPTERLRFTVKPGITGWAQIQGRNNATWNERFKHDVWYVEHWSLWLDIKILFMTIGNVIRGRGVVTDARSVMKNLDEERARVGDR